MAIPFLIDAAGWAGSLLVLAAYLLLTTGKMKAQSRAYQAMNLLGVVGIGINSYVNRAYPSVFINVVWGIIAIYGLAAAGSGKLG